MKHLVAAAVLVLVVVSVPLCVSQLHFPIHEHSHVTFPMIKQRTLYKEYSPYWELEHNPKRKMALLIDDMQEEHRTYFSPRAVQQAQKILAAFRRHNLPIIWSFWSRTYGDGRQGSVDRFYGDTGLGSSANPCYVWEADGLKLMPEVAPHYSHEWDNTVASDHYDMFSNLGKHGESVVWEILKGNDVDTVIVVGAWTDMCILTTALSAFQKEYDVIVPRDAVGTPTPHGRSALEILNSVCCHTFPVAEIVHFLDHGRHPANETVASA
ncbi:unnamed protein product [Vitrella brassicaformis CCMP3155]|uniref:Isochorismatase-like domain-containing protein n=2 Tax=Vitrella brassicaformis TaxID=1169539 RepID=A0A0G4H3X4_VITBC|nr:unnamed protein product [Vitrella brassicaformis CCMP3155]|mmetsp:Transcript_2255/g.5133  ORF Transcript_2255/g.5133 Transcript_2255/m.5133 type:complete len:267 (+) Transcript_2255:208-1008(+)|eukprot:CEM38408.1 unnamed protein product [Vitrella brassicaformis CCMP3155]